MQKLIIALMLSRAAAAKTGDESMVKDIAMKQS